MTEAIFLSASIPDPQRSPEYAQTADTVAIAAAVSALIHVTLGRRILVWGGHPAITPMIWVVAEGLGVDYGGWVRLYQSQYFKDEFPEDNQKFRNVLFTEGVDGDREKSLKRMREQMFSDFHFSSAVFIGGMRGIIQELELLKELQPKARMLPVASTGGAALEVADRLKDVPQDLYDDLDYVALFHRNLGVSVKERRYQVPSQQPFSLEERFWKRPPGGGS